MEKPDLLHREISMLKEAYLSDRKIFSSCFLFKESFFLWSSLQAGLKVKMGKFQIQDVNVDGSVKYVFY